MGSRGPAPKEKVTISFREAQGVPVELSATEAAIFRESVRWLRDAGTPAQEPDVLALSRLARYTAKERQLFEELDLADWVEDSLQGRKSHPKLSGWKALQAAISEIESRFGFSPASRSRIPRTGASGETENPLTNFINRK